MSLKRTIYHFAGKDYEASERIEFTFYVQRVSIENFLNLNYSDYSKSLIVRKISKKIGEFTLDSFRTNVDPAVLPILIKCTAQTLFLILQKLGMYEHSDIDTLSLWVRNRNLRARQLVIKERYNGISVFDPLTKRQYYTSGSPKKIEGRQAVINGKLWRKYRTC